MNSDETREILIRSLQRQEELIKSSLVLNPVENFPFEEDIEVASSSIHSLYNSDKYRSREQKRETVHQFAGRSRLGFDSKRIYQIWSEALGSDYLSMRLLSGLQSHAAVFMAISNIGDKVLLLPETAGGHMATKSILERLGLDIVEMVIDADNLKVDEKSTIELALKENPNFIFVDRSEGLNYEDFSWIHDIKGAIKIFDCSQYLSHILAKDFLNPFEMGFDLLISTVHKNFPGPQKALVAGKQCDSVWKKITRGLSTYVSSMHTFSTYAAGLALTRQGWINDYSDRLLKCTKKLDQSLCTLNIPVVSRDWKKPFTHHLWITAKDRDTAFEWFCFLERNRILVNYRKLPYNQGFGLRLGLQALCRIGFDLHDCEHLAVLIREGLNGNKVKSDVAEFAKSLWKSSDAM